MACAPSDDGCRDSTARGRTCRPSADSGQARRDPSTAVGGSAYAASVSTTTTVERAGITPAASATKRPGRLSTWLQFLAMGTVWGASFLFMKVALTGLAPAQVAWSRLVLGALALGVFVLARREALPRSIRLYGHMTVLAVSFVAKVPVQDTVPLERAKLICSVPMLEALSGGQSLLVGYAGLPPRVVVSAAQAMPLFAPPMQVPAEQSGQG